MKLKKIALLLAFSMAFSGLQVTRDVSAASYTVSYCQKKTVKLKNAKNITVNGKPVKVKKVVKIVCKKEGRYTICYKKNKKKYTKIIWVDKTVPQITVSGEKNEYGIYCGPVNVFFSDNLYLKQYKINGKSTSFNKSEKIAETNTVLSNPGIYDITVTDKAGQETSAYIKIAEKSTIPTIEPTKIPVTTPTNTPLSTVAPTQIPTTTPVSTTEPTEEYELYDIDSTIEQVRRGNYEYKNFCLQKDETEDKYYFKSKLIVDYGSVRVSYPKARLMFYDGNKKFIGYYDSSWNYYNWGSVVASITDDAKTYYGCKLTMTKEDTGCDFSDIKYWAVVNVDSRN